MKVLYSWLREYLAADVAPGDLPKHLLMLGFEVTDLQAAGAAFSGVVIGEILGVDKHPNADRLSLCSVTVGVETLSIVCGAPNVAKGQRVAVARVGARLPGGRTMERAKIRGVESQGMICSSTELGLGGGGEGIMVLPEDSPVGEDASRRLGASDAVLDLDIGPNRPDCLSHYGLARELSIFFRTPLKALTPPAPGHEPGVPTRRVEIHAREACGRYMGLPIKDLKVGPSPSWLAGRLEALGLRPINNVVDVTNYVLLELGHPLHAFDLDKLRGPRVVVRYASRGETLKALDGKPYLLAASDLVIADDEAPIAVAGVIGGEPTGVTPATKACFLEAAHFAPRIVRRTARRLGLRTDSSYRFERGTHPDSAALAQARAAQLIKELCGGTAGRTVDEYAEPREPEPIRVSTDRVNSILGSKFKPEAVESVLKALGAFNPAGGTAVFTPPPHRLDLNTPWDLAEEVGRHLGYDSIPIEAGPVRLLRPKTSPTAELAGRCRRRLTAQGFFEAYCWDFLSKAQLERCGLSPEDSRCVPIANPLSEDQAYLRPGLLPGLLASAAHNASRGTASLRLFETGQAYALGVEEPKEGARLAGLLVGEHPPRSHWRDKPRPTDAFDAKGAVEDLLDGVLDVSWSDGTLDPLFHPKASARLAVPQGPLGTVGLLHPAVVQAWDLKGPAAAFELDLDVLGSAALRERRCEPLSPYPASTRDISVLLDKATPWGKVRALIEDLESLSRLELVDVFTGKGIPEDLKSLTIRLTFSRPDRTLKDAEVQEAVDETVARLRKAFGARLRS